MTSYCGSSPGGRRGRRVAFASATIFSSCFLAAARRYSPWWNRTRRASETLKIKVDAAVWTEEFGTEDVKADAARYFESAVWGSPAADVLAVKSVESR